MIRPTELKDLDRVLEIYRIAREFMRRNNNERQWGISYPPKAVVEDDIRRNRLYGIFSGGVIHGAFVFFVGDDPAYARIENGLWNNDGKYGVIHRIASDGTIRGVFGDCADYCKKQAASIRIDTHEKNMVMQHLLVKHGFERRGVIYLEDGSPRIAYEYTKK